MIRFFGIVEQNPIEIFTDLKLSFGFQSKSPVRIERRARGGGLETYPKNIKRNFLKVKSRNVNL